MRRPASAGAIISTFTIVSSRMEAIHSWDDPLNAAPSMSDAQETSWYDCFKTEWPQQTLNWPAARMERVLFAPNVFFTLGPLKLLGRAETAREAVAAAIVSACLLSGCQCNHTELASQSFAWSLSLAQSLILLADGDFLFRLAIFTRFRQRIACHSWASSLMPCFLGCKSCSHIKCHPYWFPV